MDKKLAAKKAALQGMSSKLRDESRKPMGEELGKRKMEKITIMAPDKKGLKKGLSKAQQILKAKFGEMGLEEDEMDYMDEAAEMEEGSCPVCGESMDDEHEHEDMEEEEEEY